MGILSNLAYAGASGVFDILKNQLQGSMIADRMSKAAVLKSLLDSMEGQDPGSPQAKALADKVKEISGVEWPSVTQEMPLGRVSSVSPALSELAQGAEAKGATPVALPGGLETLAEAPPGIPSRTGLAAVPPISSDKLMALASRTGDQETLDRMAMAKGITGRLENAAAALALRNRQLEGTAEHRGNMLDIAKERLKTQQLQGEGRLLETIKTGELNREKFKTGIEQKEKQLTQQKAKFEAQSKSQAMKEINRMFQFLDKSIASGALKPEDMEQQINVLRTTIEEYGKKWPDLLESYGKVQPRFGEPGTMEKIGQTLWGAEPKKKVIGYDLSTLPQPEALDKEIPAGGSAMIEHQGKSYIDTGEVLTIGGKKRRKVIDPDTNQAGTIPY